MLRLAKMTDYATVLLSYATNDWPKTVFTTRQLSEVSRLPMPTVGKVLRTLARAELLVSMRGVKGGYRLARPAEVISVADIVAAMEGPIALTECSRAAPELCDIERWCPIKQNWRTITTVIRQALEELSLAEIAHPAPQCGSGEAAKSCLGPRRTGSPLLQLVKGDGSS